MMRFNDHRDLEGLHAFLSPSQNSWLNYDETKLRERYYTKMAAAHGTRLHELAKELILLNQRLPKSNKTLNAYVNDAIGFRMTPEQVLKYSYNCFGTADAIKFDSRKMHLRIHDLKNGVHKASMTQLRVYAGLFCLEYDFRPSDLDIVLRIYQNDEIFQETPELDELVRIMDTIITHDKHIELLKAEALV